MEENNLVCGFADDSLVILTKATIDIFLKQENPGDLIALYSFYYYTSKWQHTNQPKCTTEYVAKGLHWNRSKVAKVKKQLMEFGLIEDVRMIDEQTKKVTGYYIKMSYVFKKTTLEKSQCTQNPPTGNEVPEASVLENEGLDFEGTNALSTNNINALSTNNKKEEPKPKIKNTYKQIIDTYTDDPNLKETILEFIKMRKLKKNPPTDNALELIFKKLDKLSDSISGKIEILEQSIVNGYQGVFELKQDYKPQYGKQNEPTSTKKFFTADMKPEDYM